MTYADITFLMFTAYLPLIWIVFRIRQRNKALGYFAGAIFAFILLAVWIVGFISRTMLVGAIEHVIVVGTVTTLLAITFELLINNKVSLNICYFCYTAEFDNITRGIVNGYD